MATYENILTRFRVYCATEGKTVLGVVSSQGAPVVPTTCPNDVGHTLIHEATKVIHTRYADERHIDTNQAGFSQEIYQMKNITLNVSDAIGGVYITDYTPSVNMCLFSVAFSGATSNIGDTVTMYINPDTNIGPISAAIEPAGVTVTLVYAQMAALSVGLMISVTDGVNTDDLGLITSINWGASTVTVDAAATHSFSPGTSYVLITALLGTLTFTQAQSYLLGQGTLSSTQVPAGSTIRMTYLNATGGTKDMSLLMQTTY